MWQREGCAAVEESDITIDAIRRATVIDDLLSKLRAYYVFPEVAERMEEAVRERMSHGDYDEITTGSALRDALTAHLQEVGHDKHLRVFFSAEPQPPREGREPSAEEREELGQHAALTNFGFERVERLAGNVGYLELRIFGPADVGGPTAVAAMNLLAHASAIIIDLRKSGGSDPATVALLSSYFFDEPTQLNSIYERESHRTVQFWTLPYVPGPRMPTTPLFVLISRVTFSGAEDLAHTLQQLKRATTVGEVTGGGAHPCDHFQIDEHFVVRIPTCRSINPISGTNWEGTGVTPDIAVPQEDALKVAHIAALKLVVQHLANQPSRPMRELREEARQALAALDWSQPA